MVSLKEENSGEIAWPGLEKTTKITGRKEGEAYLRDEQAKKVMFVHGGRKNRP